LQAQLVDQDHAHFTWLLCKLSASINQLEEVPGGNQKNSSQPIFSGPYYVPIITKIRKPALKTTLVLGATGNTGRPLVEQLLNKNHKVRVIVRSTHKLSTEILENPNATIIEANVLDLTDVELAAHVKGCDAIVSCLGHNLDFKGMFGKPRKLCTDAIRRLCVAIETNNSSKPTKVILMNTVGVQNPKLDEKRGWAEKLLLTVLRYTIPPHRDNETAAEYLHQAVGIKNKHIEWCAVRPDSLINAVVSQYEINESPSTGIFTGRPSTRSNVAHFMVELIEKPNLWNMWKFRMPVIMNSKESV
jgi:putative NADH-flavin reductase